MELETLKAFEAEVRKEIPEFDVRYKDTSWTQKVLGFLAYPFNPQYMTRYTTTVSPHVFFPSQADYESQQRSSFSVLAHEMVHLVDTKNSPIWWRISYLLPQILGVLPLIAYALAAGHNAWTLGIILLGYVLGCVIAKKSIGVFWCIALGSLVAGSVLAVLLTGWVSTLLFVGLALFAPWPSPWRTHWELRGYAMTLAIVQWSYGGVPDIIRQSVLRNFVTGYYYFMSWNSASVDAALKEGIDRAQSGALQTEVPYAQVYAFMASNDLLKK